MQDSPANRLASHWHPKVRSIAPEYKRKTLGETVKPWEQRLEEFMGEHPKLTVAAAAAVGLLLGWMVKRR
jgi:ElaB/YqjD/DUF883 family membrane-anchored ribosome-binding protein